MLIESNSQLLSIKIKIESKLNKDTEYKYLEAINYVYYHAIEKQDTESLTLMEEIVDELLTTH
jgi:hypothetical protein